jgi:hypothetical protein
MQETVKFVVSAVLDQETVSEITLMRQMKLEHYKNILQIPERALTILKNAGLTEADSADELLSMTKSNIEELEHRLMDSHIIYDDELAQYAESIAEIRSGT